MPDPLIMEFPGIPGKLRSQTLDEYMSALIPEHPARQELATLRSLALEGAKSANRLMELMNENSDLKKRIEDITNRPPNVPTTRKS